MSTYKVYKVDLLAKACDKRIPIEKRLNIIGFLKKTAQVSSSNSNYISMVELQEKDARELGFLGMPHKTEY